ncbi:MAG: ABC transporter ATP-binding protein [Clostridia bacterium]|nr:ABC transporter ATP-binding protein [Clostridia bacterium]
MKVLKGLKKYILWLMIFSSIISYFSLQIANYIRYAIDGILFHNTNQIPNYLNILLEMGTIKGLIIISIGIMIINLIIVIAQYIRERITTVFTLKISSNLKKILYAHILKLEYDSYQSYSKVEMLQRANEDARGVCQFL